MWLWATVPSGRKGNLFLPILSTFLYPNETNSRIYLVCSWAAPLLTTDSQCDNFSSAASAFQRGSGETPLTLLASHI